jgi:hypothetical protein
MEKEIVDLTAENDDEEIFTVNENSIFKRTFDAVDDFDGLDAKPPSKKTVSRIPSLSLPCNTKEAVTYVEAPVKLLATDHFDEKQSACQSQFTSLRKMLLIGEMSIDWMIIANYMVDFDF